MTETMPSAIAAADAVRNRERSAVELTEQCLDAIAKRNPELNAFVHLDADGALDAANASTHGVAAGEDPGPLAGVPFGVKDLDDCAGMPTTHGSRWYLGSPPVESDSLHVARLRAAGAIPIGKTAAPEFGTFAYTASPALGVTRNPGTRSALPAVRAAAPLPRSPRGWCRSRPRATVVGRRARRRGSADWSA